MKTNYYEDKLEHQHIALSEHYKELELLKGQLAAKEKEWTSVEGMEYLATESGNWDGKRSDIYLGKYANGDYCLFRIYTGTLDGHKFTEYYDQNDDSIHTPRYYKTIN